MRKVAILGGGVAGMTAAHELAERGYKVTIYELRQDVAGGKARTQPVIAARLRRPDGSFVTDPPSPANEPLPGEHGFRFFPGFYKHIPDTMRRIPFPGNPQGVLDNLRSVELGIFSPRFRESFPTPVRFPRSLEEFKSALAMPERLRECGLTDDDFEFFMGKLFQIVTSCRERRDHEYSRIGWWDFVEAGTRSEAYQLYLATGITRNAVATQAHLANTRTIGDIGIQLILDMTRPGTSADRILTGPTNQVWIDPWLAYLREGLDVDYLFGAKITAIDFDAPGGHGRITGVDVLHADGAQERVTADHYVMALPVEIVAQLFAEQRDRALASGGAAITGYDSTLRGVYQLKDQLNWMTGIQYYLRDEIKTTRGHINALGSPWALTAIEEVQFWPSLRMDRLGDGTYKSILSVDISDWSQPGVPEGKVPHKIAKDCTHDEIAEEVWLQLKQCMNNGRDAGSLPDTYDAYWLDEDIVVSPDPKRTGHNNINTEPLLVNLINSWDLRPDAWTRIPNLVIAGDYVRTNTDFASMEGACEAARRATNAILTRDNYQGDRGPASVWPLEEPEVFAPFRERDRQRYLRGLPWASPAMINEEVEVGLQKLVTDAVVDGKELLRGLNPLRLVSKLRDTAEHLLGAPEGESVEDLAAHIIARNAGRVLLPDAPWLGVQRWDNLLFLHHRALADDLRPLVHPDLEIDTFDGSAWVTLVPMYMGRVYLAGVGDLPEGHFPELNLRTYVRHKGRAGVWFFRIHANARLANWAARAFFSMPYHYATMTFSPQGDGFRLTTRRQRMEGGVSKLDVAWTPRGGERLFPPGSLARALGERYCAFAADRDGDRWKELLRGDLIHDPWTFCEDVEVHIQRDNIWSSEGIPLMQAPPADAALQALSCAFSSSGCYSVTWPFEAA